MVGTTGPLGVLAKTLDPLKPVLMHPEVVDESKWFKGRHPWMDKEQQYVFGFVGDVASSVALNSNLVKPGEIKSYWDILTPKWKGKIMARDIRGSGPGAGSARMIYHHPELGPKFLYTLYKDMDAYVSSDARTMADYLAKGRYAFFFFTGAAEIAAMQAIGLPVDNRIDGIKEGGFLSTKFGTLALMNKAPHPHAAKLFINWALSREGQTAFQRLVSTPNDPINSLRMDIPKDHLAPHQRLKPEGKYFTSYEHAPVEQLAREALLAAGRK
jgi:ABC-type Fe3+ transport system substrate-binding protein